MIGLCTEPQKSTKNQKRNLELNQGKFIENILEFYFQQAIYFGTMPAVNNYF